MSKRRSIASGFGLVSLVAPKNGAAEQNAAFRPSPAESAETTLPTAGVNASVEAATGRGWVEIDPLLIDSSPFRDRMADTDSMAFSRFVKTIADEGQKVPVQLRPHPVAAGRFQIAYGHRRVAAARQLGIPVKALIAELDDRDLAIAQGLENSERLDLSWIERALFAEQMDKAAIRPRDIYVALSIDDAELARMRGVCRSIPVDMIEAIGKAPKIGRPRWVALARAVKKSPEAIQNIRSMLNSDRIRRMTSDERFLWVSGLLTEARDQVEDRLQLCDADGNEMGELRHTQKEFRVVATNDRGVAFANFLRDELPALLDKFVTNLELGQQDLSADRSGSEPMG